MTRLVLALLLSATSAQAQLRHSITADYTGAYFWGASGGGPLAFERLYALFTVPGTLSYYLLKDDWGASASYSFYERYFNGSHDLFDPPDNAHLGFQLYTRNFTTVSLNGMRRLATYGRGDAYAVAGITYSLSGATGFAFLRQDGEFLTQYVDNGSRLGFNIGLTARYRIWKGFTLQASASHTKLLGALDFNHISNLRIGYGYTFGGGINRTQKRRPAP